MKDEFSLSSEIGITLDSWNDLYLNSGVYSAIFSELVCVVSKYPKEIHRDAAGRLHNTLGSAVEWNSSSPSTKWDCFYIHGRNIDGALFEKCLSGNIYYKDYLEETNDERRSAIYEIIGAEKMMVILQAKEIDTVSIVHANGEVEKITIYRTKEKLNIARNEPYAWIKRICPSTGSTYLTPTNPSFNKAIDAAKFHRPEFVPKEIDYKWFSRS